ncbi:MAG TPA: condensation domain-containing protein, partial [Thermoanaerobaculia bacterium]|nr:condensation domain-containing protein [Thermoanaerobaculia bacterium]
SPVEPRELRAFLAARLPAYMVPARFVPLDALPLSPSGKVDRNALPAPGDMERAPAAGAVAGPSTPAEAFLAGVWTRALGVVPRVSDNFFELGGDSIRAAEVVFRARQAGLALTLRDCFRHQTLRELAAAAGMVGGEVAGGAAAAGEIALTAAQRHFFSLELPEPQRFTQSLLLALRDHCGPGRLAQALGAVVARHAALQVRFSRRDDGQWRQELAPWLVPPLAVLDLAALPTRARGAAFATAAVRLEESLDLERGPLLRAMLCERGDEGQRVFLVLHHLIADGASWRILLADLDAACHAVEATGGSQPEPALTALRQWAERPAGPAFGNPETEDRDGRRPRRRPFRAPGPLPVDGSAQREDALNSAASARLLTAALTEEETRALLVEVPALYNCRAEEAQLSALVQAFAGWTGEPRLLVDVEAAVREGAESRELSRTVGRLSPLLQVLLELDRHERDPAAMLRSIKQQLRSASLSAAGYGAFRGPSGSDAGGPAAGKPHGPAAAPVIFRDLRPHGPELPAAESSWLAPAAELAPVAQAPGRQRPWQLEIESGIAGGRLCWRWIYSANLHQATTVQGLSERFAGALRSLIAHRRAAGFAAFTPADFPGARLSQQQLDKLMARIDSKRASRHE